MEAKMSLSEIVNQLEFCDYQCIGGPLTNNVAFLHLKELAAKEITGMKIINVIGHDGAVVATVVGDNAICNSNYSVLVSRF